MRFLILVPLFAAFVLLEFFIGGARLLYALPALLLIAGGALLSCQPSLKTSQRASLPALISTLLFALYIGIRNRCSEIEYIGRTQFFILVGCLLLYLMFTLVLTKPSDRTRFFIFLGILGLIQMIPALIQFTQKNQWMPLPWAQRGDKDWMASGFFICHTHFSGFLEIITLFATSYLLWGRTSLLSRIITGYIALVCLFGVAISGSRGGYVSLAVGLITLLLLSCGAWVRMKKGNSLLVSASMIGVLGALITIVLVIAFQNPVLSERAMLINDPHNCRILLWSAALQQFHLSPIWGTGAFSYLYYGRLFRDLTIQNDPIHVHNDYLQVLADYGVVGLLLVILLLIVHLRAGVISFFKLTTSSHSSHAHDLQSDRLALTIGALSAVAAYLIHSLVDFNMQLPLNAFTMAVVLAVLANPGSPAESTSAQGTSDYFRIILRYGLPLLGVATMIYAFPMIRGEYYTERVRVALRDGYKKQGLEFAREGTQSTHDNPELYYQQGEAALDVALLHEGDESSLQALRKEALDSFAAGRKIFPYDSRLVIKSAQAKALSGDYFSALQDITYAEQIDPHSAFVSAYRGMVDFAFGYYNEAKSAFERSRELGGEAVPIAEKGLHEIEKIKKAKTTEPALPSSAP